MRKSTKSPRTDKPVKPYPEFPLFPHATRRWAKKIRGRMHYFGPWDNPEGALERLNREWPYLSQGRTPPPVDTGNGCTVQTLCNTFLTSKKNKLDSGELSERSFRDYYEVCRRLIEHFGPHRVVDDLRPDDFERFRKELAEHRGVVTLKNEINRCRVVFKYAFDQRLISQPVNYGQSFNRPSARMLRKARHEAGPRMFEAAELRTILNALGGKAIAVPGKEMPRKFKADPTLRAMVLLGLNCGLGNTDVATLPRSALDLEQGWINFPRPKTLVPRRVPLWPETIVALREAIALRPNPKVQADDGLCFLTAHGKRWVRVQPKAGDPKKMLALDALAQRFAGLLKQLGLNGRSGAFYTLRHVFETIAGESRDQVAVNAIMGHVDNSMAGVYRQRISDKRLLDVVQTVRTWLWPPKSQRRGKSPKAVASL